MVRQPHHQRATALARLVVLAVTLTVVIAGTAPFTVGVASAAPTPITQCTDITQPGRYVFANDIENATPTFSDPCIEVFVSDVHIDGAGYTLDGTWAGSGLQIGIEFPPRGSGRSLTNVSVTNLTFTDLSDPVYLGDVSNFEVSNNTFTTSSGPLGNAVTASTGLQTPPTDGRIADNQMLAVRYGVRSNGFGANVLVEGNEIVLSDQGRNGITISNGAGVTIASNTIDATATPFGGGITLFERSSGQSGGNDISSNVVIGAEYGVYLRAVAGNGVTTDLSNNTISGSSQADFLNLGDEPVTAINTTLDTARVTFDAQYALVSAADPTPTPPSGLTDIGQFVATGSYDDTRPSSLVLTLHYQDADVSGIDESTLALSEYNVSTGAWVSVPGGEADAAGNVVGPVSVPLEQAGFLDRNTGTFNIEFQQVLAPLATPATGPTVAVGTDGNDRSVSVADAEAGEPVEIPLEQTVNDDVTLDSMTVTTSVDTDYTLDVTGNDTAPSGTTELSIAGPNGTVSVGYLTVDESLDESEIQEVVFRFSVDATALSAAGVDPDDVALYRYNETSGMVDQLPTTNLGLNATTNRYEYEAVSPGLSVFGVAGLVPNIVVTAATANESEVLVDESVLVTATVENDGGAEGSATLNLTVDGVVVDAETVTLGPGASTTVEFVYTFTAAGTYELAVDGVVAETVLVKLPVDIDVQPDDAVNELPPSPNAAVPVAVLGSASFDPVTEIDVSTVRFGAASAVESGGGATAFSSDVADVNGDGIDDLVLVFRNADTGLDESNTLAVLTGDTAGGLTVYGTDTVTVKTKGNGKE